MWSRLLSVLLPTLLWSTQAFLVPHSLAARGAIRCFSRGRREQPLSAHSERRSPAATGAAEVSTSKRPRATSGTVAMSCSGGACDRRAFFSEIARAAAGLGLAAGTLAPPEAAAAKEELDAPVDWKAEFGAVKKSTDLVVSDLRNLATSGDWEELMDQCKGYDQSIRKGLMGNVRKKMPKELKGDAMLYRNNITFDLIAVNKAARVEDKSKALEVIDVLESDIKDFLNLEKRI